MSEALARVPVTAGPVGAHLRGVLGSNPRCASCQHRHRVTDHGTDGIDIEFDACCPECGCTASGAEYDRGVVDVDPAEFFARIELHGRLDDKQLPIIPNGLSSRALWLVEGPAVRGADHGVDHRGPGLFGWVGDQQRELAGLMADCNSHPPGEGRPPMNRSSLPSGYSEIPLTRTVALGAGDLGYFVLVWAQGRWNADWDGELHATREGADASAAEAIADEWVTTIVKLVPVDA